tara:strand:- start:2797 stop:3240 length:444 start_codon:yes stop_codon:yes gene_type:complete
MGVRENILANLKSTLEGITTGNGYNTTVNAVYDNPLSLSEVDTTNLPIIDISIGAEDYTPLLGGNVFNLNCDFLFRIYVRDDGSNNIRSQINNLLEDIDKAIIQDGTRGSTAIDTTIGAKDPPRIWSGKGQVAIADVIISVLYRRDL